VAQPYIDDVQYADILKLQAKHSLTDDDVRSVVCDRAAPTKSEWSHHPTRGTRLIIEGDTWRGVRIRVVLVPLNWNDPNEGTWIVLTAHRLTNRQR
jgi:hypothetical protein